MKTLRLILMLVLLAGTARAQQTLTNASVGTAANNWTGYAIRTNYMILNTNDWFLYALIEQTTNGLAVYTFNVNSNLQAQINSLTGTPTNGTTSEVVSNIASYFGMISTNGLWPEIAKKANTNLATIYNVTIMGSSYLDGGLELSSGSYLSIGPDTYFTNSAGALQILDVNYPASLFTYVGGILYVNGYGITNILRTGVSGLETSLTWLTNNLSGGISTNGLASIDYVNAATNELAGGLATKADLISGTNRIRIYTEATYATLGSVVTTNNLASTNYVHAQGFLASPPSASSLGPGAALGTALFAGEGNLTEWLAITLDHVGGLIDALTWLTNSVVTTNGFATEASVAAKADTNNATLGGTTTTTTLLATSITSGLNSTLWNVDDYGNAFFSTLSFNTISNLHATDLGTGATLGYFLTAGESDTMEWLPLGPSPIINAATNGGGVLQNGWVLKTDAGGNLYWGAIPISGVTSFNGRDEDVELLSGDVTNALGYVPIGTNVVVAAGSGVSVTPSTDGATTTYTVSATPSSGVILDTTIAHSGTGADDVFSYTVSANEMVYFDMWIVGKAGQSSARYHVADHWDRGASGDMARIESASPEVNSGALGDLAGTHISSISYSPSGNTIKLQASTDSAVSIRWVIHGTWISNTGP